MPASPVPYAPELVLALGLADAADALTLARFKALDLTVTSKPDLTPVTDADTAVERHLRERLACEYPTDAVHGEEYGGAAPGPGRTWVIDPIDGTKNFVRGVPVWATLVALLVDGQPVLGVVSAPGLNRRWWATTGGGAWSSWAAPLGTPAAPRRLTVSRVDQLENASVSYSSLGGWAKRRPGFETLVDRAWRARAYGDFYSHMLVAEGSVDLAAEPELALWDVAALIPIVVEAGGQVSGVDGGPVPGPAGALTTNGLVHRDALSLINAR